ncbi:MAG: hypothetical protein ACYTXT_13970 [Nostoc sp.]
MVNQLGIIAITQVASYTGVRSQKLRYTSLVNIPTKLVRFAGEKRRTVANY